MVTPVFHILDQPRAMDFYIKWLGFRIDWEEVPAEGPLYFQVSRGDIVLHLSTNPSDSCAGAKARAEMHGLPSYHHQLVSKNSFHVHPTLAPAYWNERVLEMEVVDPFGNRLIFCEAGGLQA